MKNLGFRAVFLASGTGTYFDGKTSLFSNPIITYQVCVSPACVADGSETTLEKLKALAPANVNIVEGGCSSVCGNGPIVIRPEDNQQKKRSFRKVSGLKILDLLSITDEDGDNKSSQTVVEGDLIKGYDLALEAEDQLTAKNYQVAADKYAQAIALGLKPAVELQAQREELQATTENAAASIQWLIRARCNEARAKLALGEDGLESAQAACDLCSSSAECFQVLAQVYQKNNDAEGELQALQNMFAIDVDESKLPFADKNNRRELSFRLAKLERELLQ